MLNWGVYEFILHSLIPLQTVVNLYTLR